MRRHEIRGSGDENEYVHCCESQSKQSYLSVKGNMILFAGKTSVFLKGRLVEREASFHELVKLFNHS